MATAVEGGGGEAPHRSPEELVAKAIAPVKPQYLRPPPVRSSGDSTGGDGDVGKEKEKTGDAAGSGLVKEKKSKRQLKRERKQQVQSVANMCTEVARTGNVDSCPFGSKCRFNHDLETYLAQKPADLEGTCPFDSEEKVCPYGVTCRFLGTHKQNLIIQSQDLQRRKSHEINNLDKDLQKSLWKGKVKFPNAEAQLKLLGLKGGKKERLETDGEQDEIKDESVKEGDKVEEESITDDESRPLKKSKNEVDAESTHETNNGTCCVEEDCENEIAEGKIENNSPKDSLKSSFKVDIVPKLQLREKKLIDFRGKLYLAPLTTVGNLPFRRVCKGFGADVTCGEMAMCTNLLQGQASEWALLRRHPSEDLFGVQICGSYPDTVTRTVELVDSNCSVDFIDINMGCPIDVVVNRGAGSALLTKPMRMKSVIQAASGIIDRPLTVKVRTGYFEGRNRIDSLVADIYSWGASALTIHGRSRQQRYSKLADWDYISKCSNNAPEELNVIGNGDVFSYCDWNKHMSQCPKMSACMIARGALIKPWLFTEIKEQRHWDITSGERFNILKDFVRFGLEHWGSDNKGVETTRHFLLEWLSYTYRYVPIGLLDVVPQRLNWRPPSYYGRDDLETLMASDSAADWIRISEMLLGKVPEGFTFAPKHKSNAYDRAENG
ncbi:tRNA-dihydrouridine(47) synthase [NAD(P)(+)] [Rhynchospora pubera]|uniref:tRNA-dihydrouridine(47) synthase [NAD(P)(+)] n=1 Tax=Rhynchospora pubera TaxID=906938 RepID=A0AAV8BWE6_9POAL|nr:tRNA-dihydrouridine(47) synthase [NAD(P)(+)] [Rhynchospora pubera]